MPRPRVDSAVAVAGPAVPPTWPHCGAAAHVAGPHIAGPHAGPLARPLAGAAAHVAGPHPAGPLAIPGALAQVAGLPVAGPHGPLAEASRCWTSCNSCRRRSLGSCSWTSCWLASLWWK